MGLSSNFKHLAIERFQVGDVLVTTGGSPLVFPIRLKTWGAAKMFDRRCGTHCAVIADRGDGLLYACEMNGADGPAMNELYNYDHPRNDWNCHITRMVRSPLLDGPGTDPLDLRNKMNDFMIKMHSTGVKYGFDEVLKYLWPGVKSDPYHLICSEWARLAWTHIGIHVDPAEGLISPRQWQEMPGLKDINPFK